MTTPLTLARVECIRVKIPFRISFDHATQKRTENETVIVKVESNSGKRGYGEALPRAYVTGEVAENIARTITEKLQPVFLGVPFSSSAALLDTLKSVWLAAPASWMAAFSAFDVAMHDLAAEHFSIPLPELSRTNLAVVPLNGPKTATIPLTRHTRALAIAFWLAGYRSFKVKLADSKDLERVALLRKTVGDRARIIVDANGAFSLSDSIALLRDLDKLAIAGFEQPMPRHELGDMATLQRSTRIPLIADESLISAADAKSLLAEKAALVWNIRLGKVGGFTGARELIKLARSGDIAYRLGVLVGETAILGRSQTAFLGVGGFTDWEDGMAPLLLKRDPIKAPKQLATRWRGYGLQASMR